MWIRAIGHRGRTGPFPRSPESARRDIAQIAAGGSFGLVLRFLRRMELPLVAELGLVAPPPQPPGQLPKERGHRHSSTIVVRHFTREIRRIVSAPSTACDMLRRPLDQSV